MQESFIFYDSFREVGKDMEEKSRLAFYEAIIDYALTGELDETNLPKEIKLLFKLVKPQIDANVKMAAIATYFTSRFPGTSVCSTNVQ